MHAKDQIEHSHQVFKEPNSPFVLYTFIYQYINFIHVVYIIQRRRLKVLNFISYKFETALLHNTHNYGNKVKLSNNNFSLFACKIVIRKKFVNNRNLNKNSSSLD